MESNKVFFRGSSPPIVESVVIDGAWPSKSPSHRKGGRLRFRCMLCGTLLDTQEEAAWRQGCRGNVEKMFLGVCPKMSDHLKWMCGITFGPTVMGGSQAVEHLLEEHATEFQARWWQGDGSNLFEIVASMNLVNLGESFQPFLMDLYIILQHFT